MAEKTLDELEADFANARNYCDEKCRMRQKNPDSAPHIARHKEAITARDRAWSRLLLGRGKAGGSSDAQEA